MSIKSHDEFGFTVVTTKYGELCGERYVRYDELTENVKLAAIRNGFSQWLTDLGASKEKTPADVRVAWNKKMSLLLSGVAPRESSPEHELYAVAVEFLKSRGMKGKAVTEAAEDPIALAEKIGTQLHEAKLKNNEPSKGAAVYTETLIAKWTAQANAIAAAKAGIANIKLD